MFHSTERNISSYGKVLVDVDKASFYSSSTFVCCGKVLSEYASCKALVSVVRSLDDLLGVGKFHEGYNRTEDLFFGNSHVVLNVREDRRFYEVARALEALTALQ